MNGKERVINAIQKKTVDHVPASFSCHFPKGCEAGEAALNAHLKYFLETDTDIMKIMNENLVPYAGKIEKPEDWATVKSFSIKNTFMQRSLILSSAFWITQKVINSWSARCTARWLRCSIRWNIFMATTAGGNSWWTATVRTSGR